MYYVIIKKWLDVIFRPVSKYSVHCFRKLHRHYIIIFKTGYFLSFPPFLWWSILICFFCAFFLLLSFNLFLFRMCVIMNGIMNYFEEYSLIFIVNILRYTKASFFTAHKEVFSYSEFLFICYVLIWRIARFRMKILKFLFE